MAKKVAESKLAAKAKSKKRPLASVNAPADSDGEGSEEETVVPTPLAVEETAVASELPSGEGAVATAQLPAVDMTGLQLYWHLAAVDESVRVAAAAALVREREVEERAARGAPTASGQTGEAEWRPRDLEECSPNLRYALGRLVRGLASSRGGARQGFALALAGVLKTCLAAGVAGELLPQLLEKHLELPTGGGATAKGQDTTELLLGRVFAYGALVRSQSLQKAFTLGAGRDLEDAALVAASGAVDALIALGRAKSFLAEPATEVLLQLIAQVPSGKLADLVERCPNLKKEALFAEEGQRVEDASPEALLVTLRLWPHLPASVRTQCPLVPSNPDLLFSRKHLHGLLPALKEASRSHPRLHAVWDTLLDWLLPNEVRSAGASQQGGTVALAPGEVDGALEENRKTKKAKKGKGKEKPQIDLDQLKSVGASEDGRSRGGSEGLASKDERHRRVAEFCRTVLDEGLLQSSHERKHLALELFHRILTRLTHLGKTKGPASENDFKAVVAADDVTLAKPQKGKKPPLKALPAVEEEDGKGMSSDAGVALVGSLLSVPLLRTLLDALRDRKALLHSSAKRFLARLESWADEHGQQGMLLSALQLHSRGRFDALTQTGAVARLTTRLDHVAAEAYLATLQATFVQGAAGQVASKHNVDPSKKEVGVEGEMENGGEEEEEEAEGGGDGGADIVTDPHLPSRRIAVELMCALCRQLPEDFDLHEKVLRFLLVHALLPDHIPLSLPDAGALSSPPNSKKKRKQREDDELLVTLSLSLNGAAPLSSAVRAVCRTHFQSLLGRSLPQENRLIAASKKRKATKASSQDGDKEERSGTGAEGDRDGKKKEAARKEPRLAVDLALLALRLLQRGVARALGEGAKVALQDLRATIRHLAAPTKGCHQENGADVTGEADEENGTEQRAAALRVLQACLALDLLLPPPLVPDVNSPEGDPKISNGSNGAGRVKEKRSGNGAQDFSPGEEEQEEEEEEEEEEREGEEEEEGKEHGTLATEKDQEHLIDAATELNALATRVFPSTSSSVIDTKIAEARTITKAAKTKGNGKGEGRGDGQGGNGEGGEEPPKDIEVLLDVLLSLLAQPSPPIRQAAESAFAAFCSELTPTALHDLLRVIAPKPKPEGRRRKQEANGGEEEDEDEDDDDDGVSGDDDSEGNDEDNDDGKKRGSKGRENGQNEKDSKLRGKKRSRIEEGAAEGTSDDDNDEEADKSGRDAALDGALDEMHKKELQQQSKRRKGEKSAKTATKGGSKFNQVEKGESNDDSEEEDAADDDEDDHETGEEDEEEEEEEAMDDEAMFRVDALLAQRFRAAQEEVKRTSAVAKAQEDHFRLRVLSLLDIFLHRCPKSPLLLDALPKLLQALVDEASTSSTSVSSSKGSTSALVSSLEGTLRRNFSRGSPPALSASDSPRLLDLLKSTMTFASRSAPARRIALVCGACALWLLNGLVQQRERQEALEQSTRLQEEQQPQQKKKKKKQQQVMLDPLSASQPVPLNGASRLEDAANAVSPVPLSSASIDEEVRACFSSALSAAFSRKKNAGLLPLSFFKDASFRFPSLVIPGLLPTLLLEGREGREFTKIESLELLQQLLTSRTSRDFLTGHSSAETTKALWSLLRLTIATDFNSKERKVAALKCCAAILAFLTSLPDAASRPPRALAEVLHVIQESESRHSNMAETSQPLAKEKGAKKGAARKQVDKVGNLLRRLKEMCAEKQQKREQKQEGVTKATDGAEEAIKRVTKLSKKKAEKKRKRKEEKS